MSNLTFVEEYTTIIYLIYYINVMELLSKLAETIKKTANVAIETADVAIKTAGETVKTADVAQTSVNEITRNTFKTTSDVYGNVSELTQKSAKTAKEIGTDALGLSREAASTASDIGKTGLTNTGRVTIETLDGIGKLTTTSISATSKLLQAILGPIDNRLAKFNSSIDATKQSNDIYKTDAVYEKLRDAINKDFEKQIKDFKTELNRMFSQQERLITTLLNIYQSENCNPGKVYGYNCDKNEQANIETFRKNLGVLTIEKKNYLTELNTLITSFRVKTKGISNLNIAPTEYAENLKAVLPSFIEKAVGVFNKSTNGYTMLSKSITDNKTKQEEEELEPVTSQGGRQYIKRKYIHKMRSNSNLRKNKKTHTKSRRRK